MPLPSDTLTMLADAALDAQLRRLTVDRGVERGIGQRGEGVRRERHQSALPLPGGVGWRTGRPAAR